MQAALIVILAQIGCFVPARFASLRCVDRLFTRIGTGDSIENNSSSFMEEMQVKLRDSLSQLTTTDLPQLWRAAWSAFALSFKDAGELIQETHFRCSC